MVHRVQNALSPSPHVLQAALVGQSSLSRDIDLYLVPQPTLIEMAFDAELACAEKYLRGVATSVTLDGVPTETVALAHQREVFGHRWDALKAMMVVASHPEGWWARSAHHALLIPGVSVLTHPHETLIPC
jgi:hypothetical protein